MSPTLQQQNISELIHYIKGSQRKDMERERTNPYLCMFTVARIGPTKIKVPKIAANICVTDCKT